MQLYMVNKVIRHLMATKRQVKVQSTLTQRCRRGTFFVLDKVRDIDIFNYKSMTYANVIQW